MSRLTVGDLIAMDQLGCTAVAGMEGLDRRIVWAHTSELDPWDWLGADELLMTAGLCVPSDEQAQCRFVERLYEKGLAGVIIGDDATAPPLTGAMVSVADRLKFPILRCSHTTPFAAIGRTVALASQSVQVSRVARLSRLYEHARSTSLAETSLLERLSRELGYTLHVVDVEYSTDVLPTDTALSETAIASLASNVAGTLERLPAHLTLVEGANYVMTAHALPTHRKCMLVMEGSPATDVDAFALLHVRSLIGVEVEKVTREREYANETGEHLLQRILAGSDATETVTPLLEQFDLAGAEWTVLSFGTDFLPAARTIAGDRRIPNVTAALDEHAYMLLPTARSTETIDLLGGKTGSIGVSPSATTIGEISDSARQASWALDTARSTGVPVARYSIDAPLFVPRTLTDARHATDAILGELLLYDQGHESNLVETLETFLANNRSWTVTADRLGIHRQSLVFRLRKIETVTGRNLKASSDIAMLWLALRARAHAISLAD
ncbi:PucR family transcriptional regulator ligand-binding domain-containing protein [Rhodococcus oxybenzonivorans]|uniref:PucR family transcriptional regulator n=1 Tax=Rhodococcus oxybenzonivorans TaxID=1990687 RepID=UPI00295498F6|nr:PucR family transcriptional regulator ligand-binding domain-containing protein [Rhodococcus oxybenzonivorans]MDV7353316.1 PucR family transcriptional regulator ligand-binding domain-containing protein [Rhodococcus oxybenzonivorans]